MLVSQNLMCSIKNVHVSDRQCWSARQLNNLWIVCIVVNHKKMCLKFNGINQRWLCHGAVCKFAMNIGSLVVCNDIKHTFHISVSFLWYLGLWLASKLLLLLSSCTFPLSKLWWNASHSALCRAVQSKTVLCSNSLRHAFLAVRLGWTDLGRWSFPWLSLHLFCQWRQTCLIWLALWFGWVPTLHWWVCKPRKPLTESFSPLSVSGLPSHQWRLHS